MVAICRSKEVIITKDGQEIAASVHSLTQGAGAYGGLDAVAGQLSGKLLAAIRPKGTLLVYGLLGGSTAEVNVADILFQRKVCCIAAAFATKML